MSSVMSHTRSNVIPFKKPEPEPAMTVDIDLLTAVDAAIRDLRDIAQGCDVKLREQADECRRMLERAYCAAMDEA
jgi:hypothetical protein